MRIGLLVHDLHGGGAEAVARSWASCLTARGHDVVFLLYGPSAAVEQGSEVPRAVFPGRSTAARWLVLPWWLRREAEQHRLDVVLSVLDFSNIMAVLAGLGSRRPVVLSEHATPSLLWRHRGLGGAAKRRAARILYSRADAVLAVSHAVATDLRVSLAVAPDRVAVLPNPVPAVQGTFAGLPAGADVAHRVLVVGRCAPEKQIDRALAVVRELRARGLDWSACVIGDGPLRPALQELAARQGLPVEFLGWVSPWPARARRGDVLLVASDLEGFGNVLVEAAAAGVPSVAPSPALGVGDALLPELTGVLSPTSRVEDLADAVLRATRVTLPTPAVRTWLDRFDPETVAERLEAVLSRVVLTGGPVEQVVTQVGPAPDAQGGMASVLRTYREAGVPGWRMHFLTSYVGGSAAWSAGPAARALLRLALTPGAALGVVHVHVSYDGSFVREGALAWLARLRGRPVVLTVHGSDFARSFQAHRRLALAVLRQATTLVLLSEEHRDLLPPDVRRRAVIVPNTVTSDPGPPTAPSDAPRAVFAGEVSTRKGVDVLLAAWPEVRRAVPQAELVLAGPVADVVPTEAPGVTWAGPVENEQVRALLRQSRVAVLPSRREAMPMFVLEAMAAGRAVVCTPVGAVADAVGEGGRVVPVADVPALAGALVELLSPGGPAGTVGRAARARFQKEYAPERGLSTLRIVYEAAARRRPTAPLPSRPAAGAAC